MKKLLDHDELTGLTQVFHGSADGETFTIETLQDITPLIDQNKASQNERLNKSSEMWHAASIPSVVQVEWMTIVGVDLHNKNHWPGVKRLLNSSDYAHLRRSNFQL